MRVIVAMGCLEIELGEGRMVRARSGDQHMVDLPGQFVKEPTETVRVGGIERGDAGAQHESDTVQLFWITCRDDDRRSVFPRELRGLETDSRAAPDDNDRLTGKWWSAVHDGSLVPADCLARPAARVQQLFRNSAISSATSVGYWNRKPWAESG